MGASKYLFPLLWTIDMNVRMDMIDHPPIWLNRDCLSCPSSVLRHFSEQLFLYCICLESDVMFLFLNNFFCTYCVCIESNVTFLFEPTFRTFLSQMLLNIAKHILSGLGFCTICREWSLMDLKQIQLKKSITLPIQWDSKGCVVFVRGLKWKFWCGHLQSQAWLTSNSPHSFRVQTWRPGRMTIFRWNSDFVVNKGKHCNIFWNKLEKVITEIWLSGNGVWNVHRDPLPNVCRHDIQPGIRVSIQTILHIRYWLKRFITNSHITSWHSIRFV